MEQKIKSKTSILIILIVTFIVLYLSLKNDFNTIIHQIFAVNPIFLVLCFILVLSHYYLRTIVLNNIITKFKKNYSFSDTFKLILKTQFFNGITPFSSGGQPYQVYMLKDGIKLSNATNIVVQNFIVYQIALVLLSLVAVISNHFMDLFKDVELLKNLVTLGFIINISVTIVLFVLAFTTKLNRIIGKIVIKILRKIKIIKNPKELLVKWEEYVENFYDGAIVLLNNKKHFLKGIFYNFMALCALYLIPLILLYGMGEFNIINSYEAIVISSYVMLIGSFVPIPGGTGGLEYGFISFYGNYIKGATLKSIMLLWRFITYYFGVILGAFVLNIKKKVK